MTSVEIPTNPKEILRTQPFCMKEEGWRRRPPPIREIARKVAPAPQVASRLISGVSSASAPHSHPWSEMPLLLIQKSLPIMMLRALLLLATLPHSLASLEGKSQYKTSFLYLTKSMQFKKKLFNPKLFKALTLPMCYLELIPTI
ncbi:hypothetical protein TNCV_2046891 [Trichonephila clavipes]|uniref:Uncharacterized protein n=1 Tax=Trichonephila clavipes TaxID=2585209 RepID=A0A8X6SV77_TRICX|nr:hypothetical protein TNCV_2046891 [Trichonephila clavipes]